MSDAGPDAKPEAKLTLPGFLEGMRISTPFGASSLVYGIAFGLLAAQTGFSVLEAATMSTLVFSGTAQIAVLQSWTHALSLLAIASTVLLVNVRYVLMGAAIRPWLAPLGGLKASAALLTIVDGSYALAVREYHKGNGDAGILMGAGILSWLCWIAGTIAGFYTGTAIPNPRSVGLDFVIVAFCASTVAMMVDHIRDYVPAVVALAVVIIFELIMPGPWGVVAAGLAAAFTGAIRYRAPAPVAASAGEPKP